MFEKDVVETPKGLRLVAVGDRVAAALKGGRIVWLSRSDEATDPADGRVLNQWTASVELPRGVRVGDVVALHPMRWGLSLVTKEGALWTWINGRDWFCSSVSIAEVQ